MHLGCLLLAAIGLRTIDITILEMERAIKHQQVYGHLPQDLSAPVRDILEETLDPRG